jgi:DNA-binding transcriptional LysR family regulator
MALLRIDYVRHLPYFLAVTESRSFHKAAQRMYISVPGISRHIRLLEEEIRAQLFVRDRRRVALTDAGRILLRDAKTLASVAEGIAKSVGLADKGDLGQVRIGMGSGLADKVTSVVVEHARHFPSVEIHCREMGLGADVQNSYLLDAEIDVGFMRPPIDEFHLAAEALFEEPLFVFMGKAHRLAERKRQHLCLKNIANEPLLLKDRNVASGLCDKILELYRNAGVAPNIVQEKPTAPLLVACKGIAIGGRGTGAEFGKEIAALPLDEPDAQIKVYMAWRKGEKSAAVLSFLNTARRILRPAK